MSSPTPTPAGLSHTEPTVVIVTATILLLNALLSVLFSFVKLDPGQVAALYGVSNPLGALISALVARGRTTPWEPIDLPAHAATETYSIDVPADVHEGW